MSHPTPPPPRSSSTFAPAIVLRPRPSRVLALWWLGLHGLLTATALLVGWPAVLKTAAIATVVGHAVWRRPSPTRAVIEVGADGACRIVGSGPEPFAPGGRTLLTPFWVRIVARNRRDAVDILLLADQVDNEDWRRLTAILRRATAK